MTDKLKYVSIRDACRRRSPRANPFAKLVWIIRGGGVQACEVVGESPCFYKLLPRYFTRNKVVRVEREIRRSKEDVFLTLADAKQAATHRAKEDLKYHQKAIRHAVNVLKVLKTLKHTKVAA